MEISPCMIIILVAVAGYLMGSVSFARIVSLVFFGTREIPDISEPVPGTDRKIESSTVSATSMTARYGIKYGCITSLLDILKVGLPVLAIRFLLPEHPYFLLFAFFGVLGHIYPVFYSFKGGRGESPIMGSVLAADPVGWLISNFTAGILGFIMGKALVIRWGGMVLLIPWFFLTHEAPAYGIFMVGVNFLFWFSARNELRQYREILRSGYRQKEEDVTRVMHMGSMLGRLLDQYSLRALFRRMSRGKNPGTRN